MPRGAKAHQRFHNEVSWSTSQKWPQRC